MRHCLTILFLLTLLPCTALHAQAPAAEPTAEELKFDVPGPRRHPSETGRYRQTGIGEFGLAFNIYYTVRSYNITDKSGLDNSLATSWLYSFDTWGLGLRTNIDYRISNEWRLSIMPRADVGFGILNNSYTNTHELEGLPFTRNYRGANDMQKLSLNFDLEFSLRWRFMWFVNKFNSWMVFRKRTIRANDTDHRDNQLGTLGRISDRDRIDWEQAYVMGAATGIGFEFFFMPESTRLTLFALYRPFNWVSFRGKDDLTHGMEFMIRSNDFELTDQFGIFFEVSAQLFLPTENFNDIYYTQFSIGVKFR